MIDFILFHLAVAGLAYIVTQSDIFTSFRDWLSPHRFKPLFKNRFFYQLFTCPLCLGWWAACPVYLVVYDRIALEMIAYSFSGAIVALITFHIIKYLKGC